MTVQNIFKKRKGKAYLTNPATKTIPNTVHEALREKVVLLGEFQEILFNFTFLKPNFSMKK